MSISAVTMNLDDIFRRTVDRLPEHAAVLGPGPNDRLSYRGLNAAIQTAAESLEACGIAPRSSVGLHLPSGVDYIVWNYAVWRRGGCVVPIPVEMRDAEKEELLHDISLDWVISPSRGLSFLDAVGSGRRRSLASGVVAVPIRSSCAHPAGFHSVNSAFIRFTSGTTGNSKGVVLSHESIYDRILAANDVLQIGPNDRVIWLLSMSYHFTVSIVGYLSLGAAAVLVPHHFADAVLDAIERYQGTLIYGSPLHYELLADSPRNADLSSLRLAISTASGLEPRVATQFRQRYGLPVTQALGIIEVGLPCINVHHAAERAGAVGTVLPAYRIRLQDVGLGPGMQEISFAGKGFLDAYYRPWRTRDEIMPDGWFRTGDVGRVDADGCLHLCGRSTDVINVMGMKFFPHEVESVLMAHPGVKEACVFAVRDARRGEVPHARVVPAPGGERNVSATELLEFCKQRLSMYKVPHQIEFTDALERTASGKIRHRAMNASERAATAS